MGRSSQTLANLIEQRLAPGADADVIDARIWQVFGEKWCILFTDMAGFSRRAARSGIVPFLVLIHQMQKLTTPIFEKHAGFLMKNIADSQLVLFRDPRAALAACVEAQRALHSHNLAAPEPDHLYLGCGIGYGDILKLGDEDVFGVEVNFAAKLGEDLAGPYDIFLTPDAVKGVRRMKGVTFARVAGSRLGGTKLPYYEAKYTVGTTAERKKAKQQRVRFK
jgi:class 3 adenylate cyclase